MLDAECEMMDGWREEGEVNGVHFIPLARRRSPAPEPAQNYRTARRLAGEDPLMFAFFSNRLGCIGSIIVSIIGTALLFLLLRGCNGVP
jgi:hypothetical protein